MNLLKVTKLLPNNACVERKHFTTLKTTNMMADGGANGHIFNNKLVFSSCTNHLYNIQQVSSSHCNPPTTCQTILKIPSSNRP